MVLKDKIKEDLEIIFKSIIQGNNWKLIELNIMADHIHIFISTHPKNSPTEIVKKLKGISARLIFNKYPEFQKKEYWGKHLWSQGYYIGTAGVITSAAIQKDIIATSSNP
jgi:putative transposase